METVFDAIKRYALDPIIKERICVADRDGSISYAGLYDGIKETADFYKDNCPGMKYAVIPCTQDRCFVLNMLGCQLAGFITIPVSGNIKEPDLKGIMELLDDKAFIIGEKDYYGFRMLPPVKDLSGAESIEVSLPDAGTTAEILFTTGTTGKSKGIMISHGNNRAIAENIIHGVEMGADNKELIPMPLSHSHGLRTVYANLYNGSASILIKGVSNLALFYKLMDDHGVTSIDMSPSMLNVVMELSADKLSEYNGRLDYIELGSASLKSEAKIELSSLLPDCRLYDFYGSTESGRTCTYDFSGKAMDHCIGKPAVNAGFIFVNEKRERIVSSPDNYGFIATKGGQNMQGYFMDKELTESISSNGYIYSNDLGYEDENGYIYCMGRADSIINRGGIKINPEEIENAARKYDMLEDCACIPEKDELQGQVPVLYISLLTGGVGYSEAGLMDLLKKNLDIRKIPERIVVLKEIPRAENGKILLSVLKDRARQQYNSDH